MKRPIYILEFRQLNRFTCRFEMDRQEFFSSKKSRQLYAENVLKVNKGFNVEVDDCDSPSLSKIIDYDHKSTNLAHYGKVVKLRLIFIDTAFNEF